MHPGDLKRDYPRLAPRIFELFVAQHGERTADAFARFVWHDYVVNKSPCSGNEGVGKLGLVFGFALRQFGWIAFLLAENDFNGTCLLYTSRCV